MGTVIYNKTGSYTGWIGNRMFQAAATIGIALYNKMDYLFPPCEYYPFFEGRIPVAENLHTKQTINYTEEGFHFTMPRLDPHHNHNLNGYYQSVKYWQHCEELINKTFQFKNKAAMQEKLNAVKGQICVTALPPLTGITNTYISSDKIALVSIHVRRGDYLKHPDHHPVLDIVDYYSAAVRKIEDMLQGKYIYLLIFSDDIEWCAKWFSQYIAAGRAEIIEHQSPQDDMCLMSLCDHNIIANSSFSWWGSYLNENKNKIVIAPSKDKWFGKAYAHMSVDDLYLPEWVLI